jgi:hypothetical protein
MTRPASVRWFEILMYLTCAVSVFTYGLTRAAIPGMLPGVRGLGVMLWLIVAIPLIWLAARRRKNWARWTLFWLCVVETVWFLFRAGLYLSYSGWTAAYLSMIAIEATALGFAFTGASPLWFAKDKPDVTVF